MQGEGETRVGKGIAGLRRAWPTTGAPKGHASGTRVPQVGVPKGPTTTLRPQPTPPWILRTRFRRLGVPWAPTVTLGSVALAGASSSTAQPAPPPVPPPAPLPTTPGLVVVGLPGRWEAPHTPSAPPKSSARLAAIARCSLNMVTALAAPTIVWRRLPTRVVGPPRDAILARAPPTPPPTTPTTPPTTPTTPPTTPPAIGGVVGAVLTHI